MLSESEIIQILNDRVIPVVKKRSSKTNESDTEYYSGYNKFKKWRHDIRVHAETGVLPKELLAKRSPNTTPDEWEYIVNNYKQVTMPISVDYLSTIGRAWSDNNWAIDYKGDEAFQMYVEEDVVDTSLKMSVENYFKSVFPYVKMIDSMGCVVIKPYKIPTVLNSEGELVISGTELVKPIPVYYPTDQLVAYEEDEFFMFQMKEHSVVEYGGKQVREGMIYELYDDTNIWRVIQVGKKIDYQFEIELYYNHEGASIPVTRCKGIPVVNEDDIVWQSRFLAVKDLLDEVILDSVYLRGVKNITAFPYRVMTGNICQHTMEINGETQTCDGTGSFFDMTENRKIICPNCLNTGMQDRVSPYGVMLLRPESPEREGEMKASQPAMYYVSPSIDTPQFLRDEIEKTFDRCRSILHLHTSNSEVQGSEDITATQSALDMKALYAFVKGDSDQTFSIYEWALGWIGYMRNGQEPDFNLTYPQSFDFYTDYDYLAQISEAIENGLPPFLVQATIMKYMKSLWASDREATKAYDLIMSTDRLVTMTDIELVTKKNQGLISDWEIILHDSAITFIQELIAENPNFLESDDAKEQLIAKAKEKAAETKPTTTQSILDRATGITDTQE